MESKSMYIVVVLFMFFSFLSSINPSQVCFFIKKIPTFRVPTHMSFREQGVGRGSQEGSKEGRKEEIKTNGFLFLPSHTN
jgi:hypothetical protein